ncbi:hypothetical protein EG833_01970, partial [archaeon]|nr:hypothetical protein [archaeon]
MTETLIHQMDYIHLCSTMTFLLLVMIVRAFRLPGGNRSSWNGLSWFGIFQGIASVLEIPTLSYGDSPSFLLFRITMRCLSYLCLMEFARAGSMPGKEWRSRLLVFIPLFVLPLSISITGPSRLEALVNYFPGLCGGLWAAWVMARIDNESKSLKIGATFLGFWSVTLFACISPAPFFPSSVINRETFLSATGIPCQVIQAVLMISMVAALWHHYRKQLPKRLVRRQGFMLLQSGAWLVTFLALILAGGWVITDFIGKRAAAKEQDTLIKRTRIAAASIDMSRIENLTASPEDLKDPNYLNLKKQLTAMREAAPDTRFFYIMAFKNGHVVILADSEPPESEDCSPPGQVYGEAPQGLTKLFTSGAAYVEG